MVEFEGVCFEYGSTPIIRDATFALDKPGIYCVLGPNGSGKTTLLKLLSGLLTPSKGTLRVGEFVPAIRSRLETAKVISYMPQQYQVVFPFTVAEIVAMARFSHRDPNAEKQQRINSAMELCSVQHLADRPFQKLSSGEQRRVLLAQAFAQDCSLLLLDEPAANLDPGHAVEMFSTLRRHCESESGSGSGKIAVVVTHDVNLARRFADYLLLMKDGALAAFGPAEEIAKQKIIDEIFGVSFHTGQVPNSEIQFAVPADVFERPVS